MAKTMTLLLDGIAYTATLQENTVTDMLGLQGPIELLLKRYAGQEYYAPLPSPLPISGTPTTATVHAGGLYCYEGFGVLSIPFKDALLPPTKLCISATSMKISSPIWRMRTIPSAPESKSLLPESNDPLSAVKIKTHT